MIAPGLRLGDALAAARAQLTAGGIESPALEARLIVGLATGLDAARLLTSAEHALSEAEATRFSALLARRLNREPYARLAGEAEFYGRPFMLNDACLIPRPDTETLIDAVLARVDRTRPLKVLDCGTGPGTILLTLLAECPRASGIGFDCATAALEAARANAERLVVAARVTFMAGDFATLPDGPFDVIVSNPPYIPSGDLAGLEPEVRHHDPALALDGGADGLAPYRLLIPQLAARLTPGGLAAFEFGIHQSEAITALAGEAGLATEVTCDLAGVPRVAVLTQGETSVEKPLGTGQ